MKNTTKLPGFIALTAVIAFSMMGCDNGTTGGGPGSGPAPQTVTYGGEDSAGNQYTLEITENIDRSARYVAQSGDFFRFTVYLLSNGEYSVALTHSGTVKLIDDSGTNITINITVNGEELAITVRGIQITLISGKIVDEEGKTVIETPEELTPIEAPEDGPPEQLPVAERWGKWVDDTSTATLDYSVDSDGVCTIIVGGVADPTYWKANAFYAYTAEANKGYTYVFEAWTQSGDRTLGVQYHSDNDEQVYLRSFITITTERKTYTVIGQSIPKDKVNPLEFQCADQLGTFYVKIFSIEPYTPEQLPVAKGWGKWVDDDSTATLDYSVGSDGVCTVTVGGTADPTQWKTSAQYYYTANVNISYEYILEAWTQSGERRVGFQYYNCYNNGYPEDEVYLGSYIHITSTRTTYTVKGQRTPKGGSQALEFQCADQLGTFYVKILSIEEYTPELEYELIDEYNSSFYDNDGNPVNVGTYRVSSAVGMGGAVVIPTTYNGKAVTEIGNEAFIDNRSITSVSISTNMKSIGRMAFASCGNLATVNFTAGSQLEKISGYAFAWCGSLTSINIPASVHEIENSVFAGCKSLTNIAVAVDNPNFSSQGGILYDKDKTELIAYPSAKGNVTNISTSVTRIGSEAFRDCESLTGVTIPSSVESIGLWAFAWCQNIVSITIPANVTQIEQEAFRDWTTSQTIYIAGHTSRQSTIEAGWGGYWGNQLGELEFSAWDADCNANIVYQP